MRNLTEVSIIETRRKVLTTRLAKQTNKYERLNEEHDDCLDAGQQENLKSKIAKLYLEMEELNAELAVLDQNAKGETFTDLSEKLPYIDFKEVLQSFTGLLDRSGKQGGVSFLVLQDSRNMGGDLLLRRLQEVLRQGANLTPHRIGFSGGTDLNEMGLLKGISKILGISAGSSSLEQLLEDVVDKICASVETRSVVLIEIVEWHKLPMQEKVFTWLCSDFYTQLVTKLSETVNDNKWRRVHIIVMVVSDDFMPDDCLNSICPFMGVSASDAQDIVSQKTDRIFDVSLSNWSEDDIEDWLEFTGLPDDRLEAMAKGLHRRSRGGIPRLVVDAIERDFINAEFLD